MGKDTKAKKSIRILCTSFLVFGAINSFAVCGMVIFSDLIHADNFMYKMLLGAGWLLMAAIGFIILAAIVYLLFIAIRWAHDTGGE